MQIQLQAGWAAMKRCSASARAPRRTPGAFAQRPSGEVLAGGEQAERLLAGARGRIAPPPRWGCSEAP